MNCFLSYARKSRRLFWRHAAARRYVLLWAAILIASAGCATQPAPVATKTTAVYELRVGGKLVQRIDATWTTEPDSGLPFEPPRE